MTVALGATAACGGGGEGESDGQAAATVPDPRASLAAPAAGEGAAVIGLEQLEFTVTACEEGPAADDTELAAREWEIRGEGRSGDGSFTVEVTRYRSDTGAGPPVVTETATVSYGTGDDVRGVEAKRTTAGAGGAWLDLTDPEADGALIARTGDAIDVRATFGPQGARAGDDGLVEGRLRARCP